MTAKLLTFLFLGILLAMAYRMAIDLVYAQLFAASAPFQIYWYVPYAVIPGLLLGVLGWSVGFYRFRGNRGQDAVATLVLAAIVILTMPSSYTCGAGCF